MQEQLVDILNYWNSNPCFTAHRDSTRKTYNMALWCLKTLMEGQAAEKMPMDEDFLSDNNISQEELYHKFTPEEIKEVVDIYAKMCRPEYIADKSKWSRSLDYFIYNPKTKRSFFFTLTGEREISGLPPKILNREEVYKYRNELFPMQMQENMYNKLIKNINFITQKQRMFESEMGQYCYSHPLKEDKFYRRHREYISETYRDRDDFSVDHIGPMTFPGFEVWVMDRYGVSLYPSHQEIHNAKEKFVKDTQLLKELRDMENKRHQERSEWLRRGQNRSKVSL